MEDLSFDNFPNFSDKGEPVCLHYPPDMFFADSEGPSFLHITNVACRVCIGCPYQMDCLTYAVENNLEGVWGGSTEHERRRMRERGKIELPNPNRRGVAISRRSTKPKENTLA